MNAIRPDSLVGDLVAERPSRARVLESHRIDYCCGGRRKLSEACAERGVVVDEVVRELATADAMPAGDASCESRDWAAALSEDLIRHIVDVHHAVLRRDLPRLVTLAEKVAFAHGEKHPELKLLGGVARSLWVELDQHLGKEEQVLFPAIVELERSGFTPVCAGAIGDPLRMMEHEHVDAGRALDELRRLSHDFTPAADACNSWRALATGLAEFTIELHRHIHEENNILHPKARALAARAQAAVSTR